MYNIEYETHYSDLKQYNRSKSKLKQLFEQ
jgi:hypothetical protein